MPVRLRSAVNGRKVGVGVGVIDARADALLFKRSQSWNAIAIHAG